MVIRGVVLLLLLSAVFQLSPAAHGVCCSNNGVGGGGGEITNVTVCKLQSGYIRAEASAAKVL